MISHSHGGRDRTSVLGPCLDRLCPYGICYSSVFKAVSRIRDAESSGLVFTAALRIRDADSLAVLSVLELSQFFLSYTDESANMQHFI